MNEDRFDQNFMWHEWSFVSPSDFPSDEQETRGYAFKAASLNPTNVGSLNPANAGEGWDEERYRRAGTPDSGYGPDLWTT